MHEQEYCQVVTTTDTRESAEELSRGAVEARLAACAQVVGPIASSYWWNGAIEQATEWQVTYKTTADRYPVLEEHLRSRHGYDVPEILCIPVVAGNPAYLRWVRDQTVREANPR